MAQALILEFDGIGQAEYEAVNGRLGVEMGRSDGNWPAGLLFHAGAAKAGGGLIVYEIWESQDDQGRFMRERLGQALQERGVAGPPARVEWLEHLSSVTPD
jgi:hypothetical protein